MKKYVIGFIFDATRDLVVLIEKINPEWQRGCLNGVGGKIELGDKTNAAAMSREAHEEAGLEIAEASWVEVATLVKQNEFVDYVFYCLVDDVFAVQSMEKEKVSVFSTRQVILGREKTLHNIPLLVQQCQTVRMLSESSRSLCKHPYMIMHYDNRWEHREKWNTRT